MKPSRRRVLKTSSAILAASSLRSLARAGAVGKSMQAAPFIYCLNTSTISGQKLPLVAEMELAAKVGFSAVEPWIREIEAYVKGGGSLPDLRKRITDLGLSIEDCIGFARWIVDDDADRAKGLEQAKHDMDLAVQIGSKRIAAPPMGATDRTDINLSKVAERYRALLELGDKLGIVAMVELWGHSKTIGTLAEAAHVAIGSHHPKACILPDVYHLYKGGSDPTSLRLLSASAIQMIHFNDYPAEPARQTIKDEHRIFPGEGIAPIAQILKDLRAMGGRTVLSLELFNRQYWKLDAVVCARTGLEKMKAAVEKSM